MHDGYSCYPQDLSRELNTMLKSRKRRHGICIFSQKELEVMHLLCRHYAIKQIAGELNVCECTINIHLKYLYEKLSVSNKQELLACLYEAGFDMSKKREQLPTHKKDPTPYLVSNSTTPCKLFC
ncbi:helix-turn-helix transcriptional regulator [Flavipsychrobacter stenotrophus]|uniref:helix-turn-helix transcriptional regulator n=1 Tax=Flavipsychrobacter stenotrophus TaxID=2077091 RepID=UPI001374AD8E|nr:helix-turn-helix transcriptional regulator [Flavipsychrobacter stenotrophus]